MSAERQAREDGSSVNSAAFVAGNARRSDFELAAELIRNQHEPPEWCEAFQRVKFDTDDHPEYVGERWVVIVAKGEQADQLAEAYDDVR